MREFVTIDFETANEYRSSACAVGLVRFDALGAPAASFSSLIRPHPDRAHFRSFNVRIHGIRPEDVADAPAWDALAPRVYDFIGDAPLVAHNMAFDGRVLNDLADLYGIAAPPNRRMCTLLLARSLLSDRLPRRRLTDVYHYYFPEASFAHHDATADAQACGAIFARMQHDFGFSTLEVLCPPGAGSAR